MGSRGFTILELLVAVFAATMVLGGIASLFVYSQRVAYGSQSQAFLQRQGAFVMNEMTQRIRTASALTRGACKASDPNSIGVKNTNVPPPPNNNSPYCFYRSGDQLFMDTNAGTWNLLSGTATSLAVTEFTTLGDPTGSPPTSTCTTSCMMVTISLQISDNRGNAMTFSTDLARRNYEP